MKATDLRIGNWYNSVKFNTAVKCDLADLYNLCANSEGAYNNPPIDEMFEPIPLTEEWLVKLSYNKETIRLSRPTPHNHYFILMAWVEDEKEVWRTVQMVSYVHEWQNLYFALTGKELTIKE